MGEKSSVWTNLPASDRLLLKLGTWLYKSMREAHSLPRNVPGIVLASMALGVLTALQYRHEAALSFILSTGARTGFLVIGGPYLLGILLSLLANRKMPAPNRVERGDIVFNAAVAFWFFSGTMLIGYGLAKFTPLAADDILTLSGAAAFAASFVGFIFLTENFTTSFTLSSPLTLPILLAAFVSTNDLFPMPQFTVFVFQAALLYSVVLFDMGIVFFAIDQTFRNELGLGGMEVINTFISFLSGERREIEEALGKIGKKAKTLAGIVLFKRDGKNVLWVVPGVHPGPFANIGGSDLPSRLQDEFKKMEVFCFHGPSSHELNPVSRKEFPKLFDALRRGIDSLKFSPQASRLEKSVGKEVVVTRQLLGGRPLHVAYKYMGTSEDIHASVGGAVAMMEGKPILIDGHNRLERALLDGFWASELAGGGAYMEGSIDYGDETAFEIFQLIEQMKKEPKTGNMKIGVGNKKLGTPERGIGRLGVQSAVLEVEGQKTAYVLIDGNNLIEGLREEIELGLNEMVDEVVVATTDNHSVNSLMSDLNPVGAQIPPSDVVSACRKATAKAVEDLERAEVGTDLAVVSGMNFLGAGKPEKILSATRAFISLSKATLPGTVLVVLALAFVSVMAI